MPHPDATALRRPWAGRPVSLTGRLSGIPSDDPIFIGTGPDGC